MHHNAIVHKPYFTGNVSTSTLNYGEMPYGMLMAKSEETNLREDEAMYDTYARNTLINTGPDNPSFEFEAPRRDAARKTGAIQLRTNGHRGDADDPAHPEIFLGFGGKENHDPRGVTTDVDYKKLVQAARDRGRFQVWTPDHPDFIIDGVRSEAREIRDQQDVFKTLKKKVKVFDRQLEGADPRHTRVLRHEPDINKVQITTQYGDPLPSDIEAKCGRALLIKNYLSDDVRRGIPDQDIQFANYTNICRGNVNVVEGKHCGQDNVVSDRKGGRNKDAGIAVYRSAAKLMSDVVEQKRGGVVQGEDSAYEYKDFPIRNEGDIRFELGRMMDMAKYDSKFAIERESNGLKSNGNIDPIFFRQDSVSNQQDLSQPLTDVEFVEYNIKGPEDLNAIRKKLVYDTKTVELIDDAVAMKTIFPHSIAGRLVSLEDAENTNPIAGTTVVQYKSLNKGIQTQVPLPYRNDPLDPIVRADHDPRYVSPYQGCPKQHTSDEAILSIGFNDNVGRTPTIGKIGKKYTFRSHTFDFTPGKYSDNT